MPSIEKYCNLCFGISANDGLSLLISDKIANLHSMVTPKLSRFIYYEERKNQVTLFDSDDGESEYIKRDGISDFIYERAKKQYGKNVTKEDIFYYVYGFLHSPGYRETFANDLKKILPRLATTR